MQHRVVYVCKAVDEANPFVATQVRWIRALADHPGVGRVDVLTRRHGRAQLPHNVAVHEFGGRGLLRTILGFYRVAVPTCRRGVGYFFVVQGGPYPALLLPLKLATRRPLYQWKAHPHVSRRMELYARHCDDLVFTATASSFPMDLAKVRVVGHGIDTELFAFSEAPRSRDLVVVGRIAPVKRLEQVMEAMARCRRRFGLTPNLDVVGPCPPRSEGYRRHLEQFASERGLAEAVAFRGPVEHQSLPALLARYRAMVNFSRTAFDKAAGEAMSTGLAVITTNACTAEMLPSELRPRMAAGEDDLDRQAALLQEVLSWDEPTRSAVGRQLRETVVSDHSLSSFFDKILGHIDDHLSTR